MDRGRAGKVATALAGRGRACTQSMPVTGGRTSDAFGKPVPRTVGGKIMKSTAPAARPAAAGRFEQMP